MASPKLAAQCQKHDKNTGCEGHVLFGGSLHVVCIPLDSEAHVSPVPEPGWNHFQPGATLFHSAFPDSAKDWVQPKLVR